jgi:hypothetical protein
MHFGQRGCMIRPSFYGRNQRNWTKKGRKSGAENDRSIGHAARPNTDPFFTPDFLPISPDSDRDLR